MKKELTTTERTIKHPLEEVFDIERGTTVVTRTEQKTTELVKIDTYDEKDDELEGTYQEIYDKAMSGYERIQDECEEVEGKYVARMMEVGVQHLNLALSAASAKAKLKEHKDKSALKQNAGPKTVNNTLVIDRNELFKQLMKADEEKEQE